MLLLGNAAQLFTRLVTTTDPEEACNIINKYIHSIDGKNKSILSGLAGVGYTLIWTQPHLQGTIKHQVDEWLTQIDNIIVDYCNTCLKAANYDYFTGLFGGLFYLLQRADSNTRLIANIESLIQGVSESIQTIDNLKVIESNKNVKNGIVEFGVAHGQAGYGAVLSHAISRGIAVQHSEKLFYQIWDTLNTVKSYRGIYPDVKDQNEYHYVPFRWCRGEFGITATLYFSLRRIGNYNMAAKLISDLPKISQLKEYLSKYKIDHTFCHGSQGIDYIIYKLFTSSNSVKIEHLHTAAHSELKKYVSLHHIDFNVQAKGILQGDLSSLPTRTSWDTITLL